MIPGIMWSVFLKLREGLLPMRIFARTEPKKSLVTIGAFAEGLVEDRSTNSFERCLAFCRTNGTEKARELFLLMAGSSSRCVRGNILSSS